jgi:hypothetical protein
MDRPHSIPGPAMGSAGPLDIIPSFAAIIILAGRQVVKLMSNI